MLLVIVLGVMLGVLFVFVMLFDEVVVMLFFVGVD